MPAVKVVQAKQAAKEGINTEGGPGLRASVRNVVIFENILGLRLAAADYHELACKS